MAKKTKPKPVGKPGDGKTILIDDAIRQSIPAERLAWLERRGYFVTGISLGPDTILFLSPRASWWADDMWDMLEAVVKLREKEAANAKA